MTMWTMWSLGWALLVAVVMISNQVSAKRGYIMTAPATFIPGRPEKICIDLIDVTTDVSVEISLYKTTHTVASQPISVSLNDLLDRVTSLVASAETTRCVSMTLPAGEHMTTKYLALSVRGSERPLRKFGWTFYGQNIIRVLDKYTHTELSLIQTDKPLYKPSQLVQIRVMRLDTRLRPLNEVIDSVHIKTPSGVRVEQWLNVAVLSGLVSLKFRLSDQPEHGNWTVELMERGRLEIKTFKVENYVLPTFEVTVKPPGFALLTDPTITAEICALYTYGLPVEGWLSGRICLVQPFMREDIGKEAFCQNITKQFIVGCTSISANRMAAGWDYRYNDWRDSKLKFYATVTENSTGTEREAAETILKFTNSPFVVHLEGSDIYKPGLPYHATVRVVTADDKPSPQQRVKVVVSKESIGQHTDYMKVYVTDRKGLAYVTIPVFVGHSLHITASLLNSARSLDIVKTITPQAWYSPTGSFLQIVPNKLDVAASCGGKARYTVEYTTNKATNVTILYKTIGVGDIANHYQQVVSLSMATRIRQRDPAVTWDTTSNWHVTPIVANSAVAGQTPNPNGPDFNPASTIRAAMFKGSFSVSFDVTSDLSPKGHLIVYYVRSDGEVVSDSLTMDIPQCSGNKVSLSLSKTQVAPGQRVQLSLLASPGSVCGYGIVDKNAFVHASQNYPTLASIVDKLKVFLLPTTPLSSYLPVNYYCQNLHGDQPEFPGFSSYWQLPTFYKKRDSYQGFISSGLIATSNFNLQSAPCRRIYFRLHTAAPHTSIAPAAHPIMPSAADLGTGPAVSRAALSGQLGKPSATPALGGGVGGAPAAVPVVVSAPPAVPSRSTALTPSAPSTSSAGSQLLQHVKDARAYFPETMLFDIININALGRANLQVDVPDTTTQWIGNAVCTDKRSGLGVSSPVTLTAFQPFSVDMKVPSLKAVRGEIIPVVVTVSNYMSSCLAVDLSLAPNPSYDVIRSLPSVNRQTLCLCNGGTAERVYNLAMRNIGENIAITVNAINTNNSITCPVGSIMSIAVGARDMATKSMTVEPEGMAREYTYGDYICLSGNTPINVSGFAKDYRLPRPRASNRVPKSAIGFVSVVGDLVGPALSNLDNLVRLPTGCGEQTMVRLVPNILVLRYLEATGQSASPALRKQAVANIKSGYQRELTYAHSDGSYSVFGPNKHYVSAEDVGSVWLTAYVMKTLAEAKRYIYVDELQQRKSLSFLVGKQDAWGCFPEVGMVHSKLMRGKTDNFALTAYVTVALIKAGYRDVVTEASGKMRKVVDRAVECMFVRSLRYRLIRDGYTMSLVSYALGLYNPSDPKATRSFRIFQRMHSIDSEGHMYWRAERVTDRVTTGTAWNNQPISANVETTSYGLLATILMANQSTTLVNGLKIVKWLNEDRSATGGYSSTQDSVVALEALTEFGAKYTTRNVNASVVIDFSRTVNGTTTLGPRAATFSLTNRNKLVHQKVDLARVRTLSVVANGDGCFIFQVNVKHSVVNPDKVGQPFTTTVAVRNNTRLSRLCVRKPLLICTSYVRGGKSGMAVMELKMQTGWAIEEELIKEVLKYPTLKVKRYEIDEETKTVYIYFSSLNVSKTCFFVYVKKISDVQNGRPAVVNTYDYYKQDERQETTYHITC